MSESDIHSGGCQCGAIRYCVSGLKRPTICHCRMCQKAVGGPFAALVVTENLSWTRGEPTYFQSSNLVRRGFCGNCGTPLTYEFEASNIDVTIASLDEPELFAPVLQLGTESRLPWCEGLAELPERSPDDQAAAEAVFAGVENHQHPDHDTKSWETPAPDDKV
ncbi:GFA family protein [Roseibium polysiphoniae]|uniref:GFA family protein n=1 Tax=Roseibium polysiphoniae TaxID=2571221 RepID=A0A944GRZ4_9HYPH|nr:GFA family protein [Roseibium polysiphoniae]MBS8259105.1 GFA family protein [Roseibium polysiphoniae]